MFSCRIQRFVICEHLVEIGRQGFDRARHPPGAFFGAVAEPDYPFARMPDVIGDLFHRLGGDAGDGFVGFKIGFTKRAKLYFSKGN